jgi:formylglycine-generating enzyme
MRRNTAWAWLVFMSLSCTDSIDAQRADIDDGGAVNLDAFSDGGLVELDAASPDGSQRLDARFSPDAGGLFLQTVPVTTSWIYSGPARLFENRTEVTVDQYEACLNAGACTEGHHSTTSTAHCNYGDATRGEHPMNCVDWYAAEQYCAWVGARLPTEDEWLVEASNHNTRTYAWGEIDPTCAYCIMDDDNAGGRGCGMDGTGPVCSRPLGHSVSGLCDVTGNVWEWTSTSTGTGKMIRGGSWFSNIAGGNLLLPKRFGSQPDKSYISLGFRCVRDTPP